MHSPSLDENAAVTAETMMVLPVMVMVFSALMLGVQAGVVNHHLHTQASAEARVASLGGATNATVEGDWVCVTRSERLSKGLWALSPLTLEARACAVNPGGWNEF